MVKVFVKMLMSTHVSSLIRSKGSKKSQLFTLTADATIRSAMTIFIEQDISAIPIRADDSDGEVNFLGMLNITDILGFILKDAPESFYKQDVSRLLNRSISEVIRMCGIKKIKVIHEQLNLMQLLFEHWGKTNPMNDEEIDIKHLLVNCGHGRFEVVTPSDFLRYVLLLSQEGGFLRSNKATEIPCAFEIKPSESNRQVTYWEEDAWQAFKKLLENRPFFLLGVVDRDTGSLEANLSAIDFLPSCLKTFSLEEAISMLRRPGLSLYAFVRATRPVITQDIFNPIVLQPHFTMADLIEKMAKLKIHQLWRVSQDRSRTPLGIVGICDVIAYFRKLTEPLYE